MTASFIAQLSPPRGPRHLLSRERLLAPLLAALDRRVITLVASGGAGKTSLLVDLQRRLDRPVCWLRLDGWQRDPLELAGALAAALEAAAPGVSASVEAALGETASEDLRLRRAALALLRSMAEVSAAVLVLDDVHRLVDQHRATGWLQQVLENLPAGWCSVLAGRRLPEIPCLTTLALEGDLYALPAEALALTREETADLLRLIAAEPAPERAETLWKQTGGWAAAVVLQAQALVADGALAGCLVASIEQPAPTRSVFEYLARAVFAEIDPEELALLHRAAVPRTLDESVFAVACAGEAAKDGHGEPRPSLAALARRHVFIAREPGTSVYRMHDLFRGYLLAEAEERAPALVKGLHLALGRLNAGRDQRLEALYHLRAAEAWNELVALAAHSIDRLRSVGRWRSIVDLVAWLPGEALALDPSLRLQRAEAFNYLNQPHESLADLSEFERAVASGVDPLSRASAHVLRGTALRLLGSMPAAVEECRLGERLLLQLDAPLSLRARAQRLLGTTLAGSGQLEPALPVLKQALQVFEALGELAEQSLTHDAIAGVLLHLGMPAEAAPHLESARRGWNALHNGGSLSLTLNNLGLAYAALGDLDLAGEILEQARLEAEAADQERIAIGAILSLAEVRRDQGDAPSMAALGMEALRRARAGDQPYHILHALLALAEAHRLLGDSARAESLAREAAGIALEQAGTFEQGLAALAVGRALAASGQLQAALVELRRSVAVLQACSAGRELTRARFVLAQTLIQAGAAAEGEALRAAALAACEAANDRVLLSQFGGGGGEAGGHGEHEVSMPVTNAPDPGGSSLYPRVSAHLFGRLMVEMGGKEPDDALWHGEKSRELLFFLLANPGVVSKGSIYSALWPNSDERTCRNNLNTTVYRLRRALYRDCVITTRETCRLNPGGSFWFDVEEFNALTQGNSTRDAHERGEAEHMRRIERAASLYLGPIDSGPLGDWAERLRRSCEHRYLVILTDLASYYFGAGDHGRAAAAAQRGLEVDPLCEPLVRVAFESELVAGRMLEALRRFRAYRKELHAEGLRPGRDFANRYAEVMSGDFRVGATVAAGRPDRAGPVQTTLIDA